MGSSGHQDPGSTASGQGVSGLDDAVGRPQFARGGDPDVHAEQRAGDQQRPGDVATAVPDKAVRDVLDRPGMVLNHGQDVSEHLGASAPAMDRCTDCLRIAASRGLGRPGWESRG